MGEYSTHDDKIKKQIDSNKKMKLDKDGRVQGIPEIRKVSVYYKKGTKCYEIRGPKENQVDLDHVDWKNKRIRVGNGYRSEDRPFKDIKNIYHLNTNLQEVKNRRLANATPRTIPEPLGRVYRRLESISGRHSPEFIQLCKEIAAAHYK